MRKMIDLPVYIRSGLLEAGISLQSEDCEIVLLRKRDNGSVIRSVYRGTLPTTHRDVFFLPIKGMPEALRDRRVTLKQEDQALRLPKAELKKLRSAAFLSLDLESVTRRQVLEAMIGAHENALAKLYEDILADPSRLTIVWNPGRAFITFSRSAFVISSALYVKGKLFKLGLDEEGVNTDVDVDAAYDPVNKALYDPVTAIPTFKNQTYGQGHTVKAEGLTSPFKPANTYFTPPERTHQTQQVDNILPSSGYGNPYQSANMQSYPQTFQTIVSSQSSLYNEYNISPYRRLADTPNLNQCSQAQYQVFSELPYSIDTAYHVPTLLSQPSYLPQQANGIPSPPQECFDAYTSKQCQVTSSQQQQTFLRLTDSNESYVDQLEYEPSLIPHLTEPDESFGMLAYHSDPLEHSAHTITSEAAVSSPATPCPRRRKTSATRIPRGRKRKAGDRAEATSGSGTEHAKSLTSRGKRIRTQPVPILPKSSP